MFIFKRNKLIILKALILFFPVSTVYAEPSIETTKFGLWSLIKVVPTEGKLAELCYLEQNNSGIFLRIHGTSPRDSFTFDLSRDGYQVPNLQNKTISWFYNNKIVEFYPKIYNNSIIFDVSHEQFVDFLLDMFPGLSQNVIYPSVYGFYFESPYLNRYRLSFHGHRWEFNTDGLREALPSFVKCLQETETPGEKAFYEKYDKIMRENR